MIPQAIPEKKKHQAVTGLIIGGPLDGTYLTHAAGEYAYEREGEEPYIYEWDCIHCGATTAETISFWRPKKRSTFWMVARMQTFYREQTEMIRSKMKGEERSL